MASAECKIPSQTSGLLVNDSRMGRPTQESIDSADAPFFLCGQETYFLQVVSNALVGGPNILSSISRHVGNISQYQFECLTRIRHRIVVVAPILLSGTIQMILYRLRIW